MMIKIKVRIIQIRQFRVFYVTDNQCVDFKPCNVGFDLKSSPKLGPVS